jgi:hypothetical protein
VAKKIVYGSHADEKFEILRRHGFVVSKSRSERHCGGRRKSKRDLEVEKSRNGQSPRNMFYELSMRKSRGRSGS